MSFTLATRHKLRVARALHRIVRVGRRAFGLTMSASTRRTGVNWHLDLNEGVDFAIWLMGRFEPELVRFYSRRIHAGDVVIDIGANIGAHTLPFAHLVGSAGRVLAVEATAFAFEKLMRNLGLNPAVRQQVDPVHALLVSKPTELTAYAGEIRSSWPLDRPTSGLSIDGGALKSLGAAPAITLDALVASRNLDRVDWIKIDVDGNEVDVFRGAHETLQRFRPHIIMELAPHCYASRGAKFDDLIALIIDEGYRLSTIPGARPLPSDASELVARHIPHEGSINVLATHMTARG